jgi:pimeloyl-ACP methyl ester carboxylesterase
MGDIVPALWLVPDGTAARGPAVLAVCAGGKADLLPRGRPSPLLAALLAAGLRVLAIDLLGAGDTAAMARRVRRDTDDPLFYAFNQSLLAMRVQDVLTALAALRMYDRPGIVSVLGVGEGARPALLALPLSRGVRAAVFDLTGLRRDPDAWDGEAYHPLALQVGELKAAVALAAPMRLTLAGADSDLAAWTRAVYRAAGKPAQVRIGPSSAARFAAGCRP